MEAGATWTRSALREKSAGLRAELRRGSARGIATTYRQPQEERLAFDAASRRPAFHTSPQSRQRQYVVASEVLLVVIVLMDRHCGQFAAG